MKYGDFSSVVQLGVGLHVGTAILQLYGELGLQPLIRTLERIRGLVTEINDAEAAEEIKSRLQALESRYDVFRIRLFNAYKKLIIGNSAVAVILTFILSVLAYKADDQVVGNWEVASVVIVALSILPAPLTLAILWISASRQVKPIKRDADALQQHALSKS